MFELTPFTRRNTLSFFDPFRDMDEFERRFFNTERSVFRTDISEKEDRYILEAELPGYRKDEISIDITDDYLTISCERKSEDKKETDNFIRRERSYGSCSRSFDISSVKADDITASYNDGILKIEMPKKDKKTPVAKKLEIQ